MSITQPLSPPPPQSQSPSSQRDDQKSPSQPWAAFGQPPNKATIDPILALELRVRWLETLVLGLSGPSSSSSDASTLAPNANAIDGKATVGDEKGRGSLKSLRRKTAEKQKERGKGKGKESATTLARLTEEVKKRLDAIVETNEGLRKFMDTCASPLPFSRLVDLTHPAFLR